MGGRVDSVRGEGRLEGLGEGPARFGSVRVASIQLGPIRFVSFSVRGEGRAKVRATVRAVSVRFGSMRFGSTWFQNTFYIIGYHNRNSAVLESVRKWFH